METRSFFVNPPSIKYDDLSGSSMTIPDQSLTVRDIIRRFTRGQMDIPPIDSGDDDDFNTEVVDFDDRLDAFEILSQSSHNIQEQISSTPPSKVQENVSHEQILPNEEQSTE